MIGYKAAKTKDGKRVVITLEIPDDATTNNKRSDIIDVNYAKLRTDKAYIVKIEDSDGNTYHHAISAHYEHETLEYNVDTYVFVDNYDMNMNNVCSTGIHFFLTKRLAEQFELSGIDNGLYETYYENGQKEITCTFLDKKIIGKFELWYKNGQKNLECTFINETTSNIFEPFHTEYYQNTRSFGINYLYGKKDGIFKHWYENGKLHEYITYVDGKRNGLYKLYYKNGNKNKEVTYVNGEPNGLYMSWHPNYDAF